MITTVTLNPAMDKVVEINKMALGEVHRVENQVISLGGKSINVARILSGLKMETKAVCFLGRGNYEEVEALSLEDQIPLEPVMLPGLTRTNVKIVEPDHGYRTTDINEAGFTVDQEAQKAITELIELHGSASDYTVLSGSLPMGIGKDYYKRIALAMGQKTRVIIDADGEVLKAGMEGAPFLIKPNIHELASAVGSEIKGETAIISVCRQLINTHGITYILVSRGEEGCILVGSDLVLSAEALPVQVLSTVGAGDSMLAGFIYGLTKEHELNQKERLKKALAYGVASSAIAISSQNHKAIEASNLIKTADLVVVKEIGFI